MLPALRPRHCTPLACLRRLLSSHASDGRGTPATPIPADAAAAAAVKAQEEAAVARMEAYRKVQNFDWSSGADWKTAANILFTVPPKRKEFGLDFHLVQLFFVCMPSLAVYLVAMYARREIKRMEAEAETKRKKAEELEKQKQLEADSVKEDADSKLATVLVRLDMLEGAVKEIANEKSKGGSAPDVSTKQDDPKKDETPSSVSKSNVKEIANEKSKGGSAPDVSTKQDDPKNDETPSSVSKSNVSDSQL